MSIDLFAAQTADADGTAQEITGGLRTLVAWGTFGGGTLKLQISPDTGATWIDVPDASFTSNNVVNFSAAPAALYRGTLSGSSGASVNLRVY